MAGSVGSPMMSRHQCTSSSAEKPGRAMAALSDFSRSEGNSAGYPA